jgi:pyruvate ferredoxin oxidoreductase delta subunit
MKTPYEAPLGKDLYIVNTGEWRYQRPVICAETCTGCGICFLFCPTNSIRQSEEGYRVVLDTCKGCGICAHECHAHAIEMEIEQR